MNFQKIITKAQDIEPTASDIENITALLDKGFDDMGEAITVAYLAGKLRADHE